MTTPDIPRTDWVYDIETYLDLFCVACTHVATGTRYIFEVSDRRDQSAEFVDFIRQMRDINARMFGFNNEFFDYPVIHYLCDLGSFTALDAHNKGTAIIKSQDRWGHIIWPRDRYVTQGDLFKIHHFDNKARSTSLKKLEINMRSMSVVDLPYPPDQPTTSAQKDEIISYMCHDVSETVKFYHASLEQIAFRDKLAETYPDLGDVLNMNDTKIGKKFFEMHLEQNGTPCYERVNGRRSPRQTRREQIALRDVISPRVSFRHPEFQRIKTWLEGQVLTGKVLEETLADANKKLMGDNGGPPLDDDPDSRLVNTKGVFKDVTATVDGFTYVFGTGGIHGSVESTTVREDDEWEIWDWDVASFYPNLAISNNFFPAHLSETFCSVYKNVYDMRAGYKKGTAENAMLKLALNGVYGDSNNKYSVFYDPQYTMSITVNGQLMLCMLAEWLTQDNSGTQSNGVCEMIQANTDGITVRIRKTHVEWMNQVCKAWEERTGLELESVRYKAMHIRDVNSYIAEKSKGGLKRIGAYAYQTYFDDIHTRERAWHQDHSMLVIRKAAEAQMVHGIPVADFITNHRDPFDFCLSVKVGRTSELKYNGSPVQRNTRYYVSRDGHHLMKYMPPLKGKTEVRESAIRKGWTVTITNDMRDFRWDNVNWLFYINEAKKLVI